jgi:deoxyribonuclease-1
MKKTEIRVAGKALFTPQGRFLSTTRSGHCAFFLACALAWPVVAEAGQTRIPDYETARGLFWYELYGGGGETLYCGRPFRAGERRGLNVEHVYPMSWVTRELRCGDRKQCQLRSAEFNRIEADLHNLYPSESATNDARGSFRFGYVPGEARRFGACDFEVDEYARVAEPRPASRGEIARAMFYMSETYGLKIFASSGRLLQQWHFEDPPNEEERRRNDRIEQLQGTRNTFIDHPERARALGFH